MNVQGPDTASNKLTLEYDTPSFGESYDSLRFEFLGNCALADSCRTPVDEKVGAQEWYDLSLALSEQAFSTAVSVEADATGEVFGASVSGSARFTRSVDVTASSVMLVAHVVVVRAGLVLASPKLRTDLRTVMRTDPVAFYQQYGDYFLAEARQGGELIIVLKHDFASVADKTTAAASLKVQFPEAKGEQAGDTVKTMLNSFQSLGTCTIHCYQSGVLGAVPDFDKVDDVIAYIDTFAEAIKASDSPRTFTVTAQKYSSIAGIDAGAAFEAVTAPAAAAVADLAQVVVDYNDLLADIDVLQGTAVDDPAQLAELQRRISTDLGTIQTDYTSCRGSLAYPTVQSLIARNEITAPTAYHAAIDPLLSRTPVQLQDHIYLRYQNDQYVGPHASGGAEYYPTMVDAGSRVRLAVLGPVSYRRVVRAGDAIRITSSESGLDGYDTLGAWLRSDCYYYTSGSPTVDEQRWTLLPVDATAQVVSYGDHVKIVNVAWNERLSRDGSYLTTTSDDDVYWIIEPASTA